MALISTEILDPYLSDLPESYQIHVEISPSQTTAPALFVIINKTLSVFTSLIRYQNCCYCNNISKGSIFLKHRSIVQLGG